MLKSVSEYLDSRLEGCWPLWNLDSVDRQERVGYIRWKECTKRPAKMDESNK